jgi:hypothetical protein
MITTDIAAALEELRGGLRGKDDARKSRKKFRTKLRTVS